MAELGAFRYAVYMTAVWVDASYHEIKTLFLAQKEDFYTMQRCYRFQVHRS